MGLKTSANKQALVENQNTFLNDYKGSPNNVWETIFLQKGYWNIIIILGIIGTLLIYKNFKKMDWKMFGSFLLISTIANYSWGVINANLAASGPAWVFLNGGWSGIEWLITLDDSIFYIVCEVCFYFLFFAINRGKWFSNNFQRFSQASIKSIFLVLTVCSFFILGRCGISVSIWFAIPAIIMAQGRIINVRHYAIIFLYAITFSTLWDYSATTWIKAFSGHPWAAQWVYNPDFELFKKWEWLWGWKSPASITPWYSIAGIQFNYLLLLLLSQERRRN